MRLMWRLSIWQIFVLVAAIEFGLGVMVGTLIR
jgi:hypothetical protein